MSGKMSGSLLDAIWYGRNEYAVGTFRIRYVLFLFCLCVGFCVFVFCFTTEVFKLKIRCIYLRRLIVGQVADCSLIRVIKQEISGETQAKRYDAQKSISCWSVFIPNFLWQAASTFQHPTTNDQRVDYRRQNM